MLRPRNDDDGDGSDGIIALVRETADGLGRLIGDHIKLARMELAADAKSYGRQVALLAGAAFVLALGYGLGCVAAALALGAVLGRPLAFGAVAGLHLVAGAVGVATAARRMRRPPLLQDTAAEVSRSVSALSSRPDGTEERGSLPAAPNGRRLA